MLLRTHRRLAEKLSPREVARRWLSIYSGVRVLDGNWVEPTEEQILELMKNKKRIARLRRRLSKISWFMGALSEYIARRANREDQTPGRFFSGRFGCRECTNDASVMISGMYIDLNETRAGACLTPETSRNCSIWWRLQAGFEDDAPPVPGNKASIDAWLARLSLRPVDLGDVPSTTGHRASDKGLLPVSLKQYVEFLDHVGRQRVEGKRGAIPAHLSPVLERLGLTEQDLLETVDNFPSLFRRIAGSAKEIAARAKEAGRKWFQGIRAARKIFREPAEPG